MIIQTGQIYSLLQRGAELRHLIASADLQSDAGLVGPLLVPSRCWQISER
jgi:hypothetical protein